MKQELRQAIHMEKHVGWAQVLGGSLGRSEPQGITRAGPTVLAGLTGASDLAPVCQPCWG